MPKLFAWLSAMALMLTVSTGASSFEGRYQVKGYALAQTNGYEGFAQIKRTRDTYTVLWQIGGIIYLGTGILTDGVLSVVFSPINARAGPGVASLRVLNNQVAGGAWTGIGMEIVAQEQWTPLVGGDAPKS